MILEVLLMTDEQPAPRGVSCSDAGGPWCHGGEYRGLKTYDTVDGQNPALPIIRNIP